MYPNIDKLRAEAKKLKKAFASGDQAATTRLRAIIPAPKDPRHADFLHVIAIENGFDSWPKFKFTVEATAMSRIERAQRLRRALYYGHYWAVQKLLDNEPDLPNESFDLQIATYDIAAVRREMAQEPSRATEKIGIRTPILHLTYSKHIHMAPSKRDAMLEIADLLVQNGADVNDGYPPGPESEHRVSALYGSLGHANNLVLAEWLLERGATPDDNESLYHATELGHTEGLKLLMKYGVSTRGTNALPRALDFDHTEAVRLLLEYGADPNEALTGHLSGQPVDTIPALHQSARRWCSAETASLLLDHGADAGATWHGHTPYALARLYGNTSIAQLLEQGGLATPLSETEAVLADCADGKAPATPLKMADLSEDDRRLLTRMVWGPSPLSHIQALVAAGLDPNQTEEMGMPPLHVAGWEGFPERIAYLLTLGPDLNHENDYGGDALSTVIHGSEFCPKVAERDHTTCARLLLEAGATLRQADIDGCGNEDMVFFLESWIAQAG